MVAGNEYRVTRYLTNFHKMDWITLLGFAAAILTTSSFVPQIIKVMRTKSTNDISLWMYVVLCTGVFLWLIYGIFINSLPVILANAVTLALGMTVLLYKIKYK